MKENTITTLCQLQEGDLFTKLSGGFVYQKIEKATIRKSKHLHNCFACRVDRLVPIPMKGNTEVVFLKKLKTA
jgi:hypothetical protein